jgi:asparagine synthase (glutamine-hydrolysing)
MPGILGLISTKPRTDCEHELARMLAALRPEPFDTTGTWIDEAAGMYLGWVVRKGSFAHGMPLRNERGDVVLVFAGEEYPEPGMARGLQARGHDFQAEGSSYLVHLYEDEPAFPASLNGMFHGVVIDRGRGVTTLFNDRFGMHRVYYHESIDTFYFAAEAKSILAVRPALRKPDLQGLGEFVACGCVFENRTLFEGIHVLPPASVWRFRQGRVERKATYFDPTVWERQAPLDADSYYRELRETIARNLPRYFNGREAIALALTGGLDTRLIMAWRRAAHRSLPCYTFGSMFRQNEDVRMARRVSQLCGQPHEVIEVGHEFLSRFSDYAERTVHVADGCIDLTHAPDLYVSEKARAIAPTKIVGTYASEVLTRVPAFKPATLASGLFAPELVGSIQRATGRYEELRCGHAVTFTAFRQSPWWHHGVLALERSQLTVRSPFLDNDFIRAVYRAPASNDGAGDVRLRLIRDGDPALAKLRTDRGIGGEAGPMASAISRAVLGLTLKAEYAYDYCMPQWLARIDHLLRPVHLERLILGRHRTFHFRIWYRDALARYVRDMLLDTKSLARPYLERKTVEAVVRGHLKGDRNYTGEIHKLLTMELQHRLFFDAR